MNHPRWIVNFHYYQVLTKLGLFVSFFCFFFIMNLIGRIKPGTTVMVRNLFYTMPVRQKEMERHAKREFSKMINLLQEYALIHSHVRLSVYHTLGKRQVGGGGRWGLIAVRSVL
jgi:hypothetical protein